MKCKRLTIVVIVIHRDFVLQNEIENETEDSANAVFPEKLLNNLTEGANGEMSRETSFCGTVENRAFSQSYFDIPRTYSASEWPREDATYDCDVTSDSSDISLEVMEESLCVLKELSRLNESMLSLSKSLKKKVSSCTKDSAGSEEKCVSSEPTVGKCIHLTL